MTAYHYPGLFGDPHSGRIWPLFVVSVVLHGGLFWAFSRLEIMPPAKRLTEPIQMVELGGGMGGGPGGGRDRAAPRPPEPRESAKGNEPALAPEPPPPAPPEPKPEPPRERKGATTVPEPAVRVPTPAPKPEPEAKPLSKTPILAEKTPPAPSRKEPARPRPEEGGEDRVAQSIARLKERRDDSDDNRVAERIARLREKRSSPDAAVADKVARLRQRLLQGSEQQVSQHVAALRDKLGTREPGHGQGATGTGQEGPVGVSGGGGPGLQGFLEARYVQTIRDHLNLYWSVTETLKGKGYEAVVSVIVDRRGKIVHWSVKKCGNRLFDEKVERAVAEADPLPPVPSGMTGERFEFELRFSAP